MLVSFIILLIFLILRKEETRKEEQVFRDDEIKSHSEVKIGRNCGNGAAGRQRQRLDQSALRLDDRRHAYYRSAGRSLVALNHRITSAF